MRRILTFLFIGLLPSGLAFAGSRTELMDKEMSCIEKHMQQSISWNDVCDIPDSQASQTSPKDRVLEHWNTYDTPPKETSTDSDLFKEYQVQLMTEFSYISYKEPSVNMKESGPNFGLYGAYYWRPPEAHSWPINVLHVDADFNYGLIQYKSPGIEINDINDYMVEPRLWLGYDFTPMDFTRLTPYAGLGYRLLFDHLGVESGIGGYDRLSEYLYAPIGFEVTNVSVPGWQFGFSAEYDLFIRGWQTSYLSTINSGFPNLSNQQNSGYGIRGSIDIIKKLEHVDIIFSPYIRYWNVRKSKTATAFNTFAQIQEVGYEPANSSIEAGAKIGVQF